MKIRPILFSTIMVEAILGGGKTQTRRVLNLKQNIKLGDSHWKGSKPYGQVGDILWVRETFQHTSNFGINNQDENSGYIYKASENGRDWAKNTEGWTWKPSLFMPKDACRIFLEITNIRVEKLKYISEEDALREGVIKRPPFGFTVFGIDQSETAKEAFKYLWCKINGFESWESNPYVWVIEFKKVNKPKSF